MEYYQIDELQQADVIAYYQDHTARETAAQFNITYNSGFKNWLSDVSPKTKHGGKRVGGRGITKQERVTRGLINNANQIIKDNPLPTPYWIDAGNAEEKAIETKIIINRIINALKVIVGGWILYLIIS